MSAFRWAPFVCFLVTICIAAPGVADDDGDAEVSPGWSDFSVEVHVYGEGADEIDDAATSQSRPGCSAVEVGTPCTPESICTSDPSSPSGAWVYIYTGVAIDGYPYGLLNPCDAPEPERSSIPAAVARAFRRIPLPASVINVQPPGGKTLVNLETIFSADDEPFQRSVRLLGRTVRLKIWPSSFAWSFGDQQRSTTTHGGQPYKAGVPMADYISHQYARAGTVSPNVDTTYSAEFSLNGGRTWIPVDGTVTINGAASNLRVVEARPVLVAAN